VPANASYPLPSGSHGCRGQAFQKGEDAATPADPDLRCERPLEAGRHAPQTGARRRRKAEAVSYGAGTNWISSSSSGAFSATTPRIQSITASVSVRNAKPVPPQVWRLKPKSHELTPTMVLELKSP
jgi:hypothetical protein